MPPDRVAAQTQPDPFSESQVPKRVDKMINTTRQTISVLAIFGITLAAAAFSTAAVASDAPDKDAPYVEHADHYVATLEELNVDIKALKAKAAGETGDIARIINRRLERKEVEALAVIDKLAGITLEEEENGGDVSKYRPRIVELLQKLPDALFRLIEEVRGSLKEMAESSADASGKDLLGLVESRIQMGERLEVLYHGLINNRAMAQAYDLDISEQDAKLTESLSERAAGLSIALELAQEDVVLLGAQAGDYPDDKDIASSLKIAGDSVEVLADSLNKTVEMMKVLEIETGDYRQQLIVSRGAVTLDIFDPDVVFDLIGNWARSVGGWAGERMPQIFLNLLLFVIIMLVFKMLAGLAKKLVAKGLDASKLNISQLLRDITIATVKNVVMLIGLLIALGQMGISVGPLLAGLGVAGFVIGFALQDTLGNFASGMMILLYRPFDVGDVVEIGGVFGKVNAMSMVNTTMLTLDNQTLILPNTKIWQDVIKNVTAQTKRRVDLIFGISYTDDIPKAEGILRGILDEHELILDEPESMVRLHELADSSVNFVVRPWVKTDDYWDVYWDVTREVKLRFDREGISIPFPQRDVHIHGEAIAVAKPETGDDKLVVQGHISESAALPGEEGDALSDDNGGET
jgi:small conductance mechanosensitive channel